MALRFALTVFSIVFPLQAGAFDFSAVNDQIQSAQNQASDLASQQASSVIASTQSTVNQAIANASAAAETAFAVRAHASEATAAKDAALSQATSAQNDALSQATAAKDAALSQATSAQNDALSQATAAKESLLSQATDAKDAALSQATSAQNDALSQANDALSQATAAKESLLSQATDAKESLLSQATDAQDAALSQATAAKESLLSQAAAAKANMSAAVSAGQEMASQLSTNASAALQAAKDVLPATLPAAINETAVKDQLDGLLNEANNAATDLQEAAEVAAVESMANASSVAGPILAEAAEVVTKECGAITLAAEKTFEACKSGAFMTKDFCLCVDAFNMSLAACKDGPASEESWAKTLAGNPRSNTCEAWVTEGGSAFFSTLKGQLKLAVANGTAFEELKGKAKAVESAMAKVVGVEPKFVSADLFPILSEVTSRRLEGGGALWFANYTVTMPNGKGFPAATTMAETLGALPKANISSMLKEALVEEGNAVVPEMEAEPLPVEVNGAPVEPIFTPVEPEVPEVNGSNGTAPLTPPQESWFDKHWVQVVMISFGVALLGVLCIAGAIFCGKNQKAKKSKKRGVSSASSRPLVATPSPAATAAYRGAGPPPMMAPASGVGTFGAPVATQAAPLPTYSMEARAPNFTNMQAPMVSMPMQQLPQAMPMQQYAPLPMGADRGMSMAGMALPPMMQPQAGMSPQDVAQQASRLFDMLDKNHDGTVSRQEFEALMGASRR